MFGQDPAATGSTPRAATNDTMATTKSSPGRQCRICRNKNPPPGEMYACGCKCFAAVHLACAVKEAQANEEQWMKCAKCDNRWGGQLDRMLLKSAPPPSEEVASKCRVCGDGGGELLGCGCACRGNSAKPIHLACAVGLAQKDLSSWTTCRTCQHKWSGELKVPLARERARAFADRPEEDSQRLSADMDLSKTLRLQGDVEEALKIGGQALRRFTAGRQAFFSSEIVEAEAAPSSEVEAGEG